MVENGIAVEAIILCMGMMVDGFLAIGVIFFHVATKDNVILLTEVSDISY